MKLPLVSVIMPFYNEERFIGEAIESILNQTYENLELILIDDYSTDKSVQIVKEYIKKDHRVRLITKTYEPRRAGISRNIAILQAKGEYVAFQDADDISKNTRIEKQIKKSLELGGNVLVGVSIEIKTEDKSYNKILPEVEEEIKVGFKKFTGRGNYFVMGTALGPKKIFINNPCKSILRYNEDWDQLLHINENEDVKLVNLKEPLYVYNQIGGLSDYKAGWIESNLFVRFSQRMREKGNIDPQSWEEFNRILYRSPIDLLLYTLLKLVYGAKSISYKLKN